MISFYFSPRVIEVVDGLTYYQGSEVKSVANIVGENDITAQDATPPVNLVMFAADLTEAQQAIIDNYATAFLIDMGKFASGDYQDFIDFLNGEGVTKAQFSATVATFQWCTEWNGSPLPDFKAAEPYILAGLNE